MDEYQLRFYTTQALYGKDLQERSMAVRQLVEGNLTPSDIEAIGTRTELALACEDEYVRSAAAMLVDGLSKQILISPSITQELLNLSQSPNAFSREAALRAIKRICQEGRFFSLRDKQLLKQRLDEARESEGNDFVLSLFDER